MLCRHKRANKSTYTCPFHGWTFNNSGKLLKVKDPEGAGYPEDFNKDGTHDLTKVPRFESYRGFLFGSLNPDVPPLNEHLGEAAKIIDMIVDQSPDGLEVLRGSSTYIYDGNWKLQTENGADGYHVSAVHWNYAATTSRRKEARGRRPSPRHERRRLGQAGRRLLLLRERPSAAMDPLGQPGGPAELRAPRRMTAAVRPGARRLDDQQLAQPLPLSERLPDGPVQLADPHYRPIAVDKTEVTIYCIAPKNESAGSAGAAHPAVRGLLQRQRHGDARRSGGIPRPARSSTWARRRRWNDMSRGLTHWIQGADESGRGDRPEAADERREDRGRRAVRRPAPVLAGGHAARPRRRSKKSQA